MIFANSSSISALLLRRRLRADVVEQLERRRVRRLLERLVANEVRERAVQVLLADLVAQA